MEQKKKEEAGRMKKERKRNNEEKEEEEKNKEQEKKKRGEAKGVRGKEGERGGEEEEENKQKEGEGKTNEWHMVAGRFSERGLIAVVKEYLNSAASGHFLVCNYRTTVYIHSTEVLLFLGIPSLIPR